MTDSYGNAASLTEDASVDVERRFGGLDRLFGQSGANNVRRAHVAVVGIGGVGSWAIEALARSGISHLTMIDMDHVSESNINRQVQAISSTVGQAKVVAMRDRIAQINPKCVVSCVDDFVRPDNWPHILPSGVDAVIDACDDIKAKIAMAVWGVRQRVPVVTVGAAGGKRLAHLVDIEDLGRTTHDPLLAQMRYRMRREHGAPRDGKKIGAMCVFSRESVLQPTPTSLGAQDGSLNCHGYGSLVSVTATFGLCAAGWLVDQLSRPTSNDLQKTL